eukprot:scaffold151957_cov33-Tisochrysis_lutea.AAC.3
MGSASRVAARTARYQRKAVASRFSGRQWNGSYNIPPVVVPHCSSSGLSTTLAPRICRTPLQRSAAVAPSRKTPGAPSASSGDHRARRRVPFPPTGWFGSSGRQPSSGVLALALGSPFLVSFGGAGGSMPGSRSERTRAACCCARARHSASPSTTSPFGPPRTATPAATPASSIEKQARARRRRPIVPVQFTPHTAPALCQIRWSSRIYRCGRADVRQVCGGCARNDKNERQRESRMNEERRSKNDKNSG